MGTPMLDGFLPLLSMILGFLQIAIPFVVISLFVGGFLIILGYLGLKRTGLGGKLMGIIQKI